MIWHEKWCVCASVTTQVEYGELNIFLKLAIHTIITTIITTVSTIITTITITTIITIIITILSTKTKLWVVCGCGKLLIWLSFRLRHTLQDAIKLYHQLRTKSNWIYVNLSIWSFQETLISSTDSFNCFIALLLSRDLGFWPSKKGPFCPISWADIAWRLLSWSTNSTYLHLDFFVVNRQIQIQGNLLTPSQNHWLSHSFELA